MFDSIYSSSVTAPQFFLMAAVAVVAGALFAWIMSRRVRSTKRFFIVVSLIPFVVAAVITFVNGNIGAGIAYGMGYLAYGVIILLTLGILYFLFASTRLFDNRTHAEEKLLKVTIPETLEYGDVFDDVFARYLKKAERLGVKTTGMGSMYRLSYLIRMKDASEEKAFLDALRIKNGNLEISILPYSEQQAQL